MLQQEEGPNFNNQPAGSDIGLNVSYTIPVTSNSLLEQNLINLLSKFEETSLALTSAAKRLASEDPKQWGVVGIRLRNETPSPNKWMSL